MDPERSINEAKKDLGQRISAILRADKRQQSTVAALLDCSTSELRQAKSGALSAELLQRILGCTAFQISEGESKSLIALLGQANRFPSSEDSNGCTSLSQIDIRKEGIDWISLFPEGAQRETLIRVLLDLRNQGGF